MDGFVRHAEALDEIDDAGHEPLRPAHVDVPAVQVGDEPAQRPLIDAGLLSVANQRVQLPPAVADQIEEFVREFRIGNLLVMLQNGSMPRELTEKNISLFAEEVLPRLRPIWDEEGWENHWWPSMSERPVAGATAGAGT